MVKRLFLILLFVALLVPLPVLSSDDQGQPVEAQVYTNPADPNLAKSYLWVEVYFIKQAKSGLSVGYQEDRQTLGMGLYKSTFSGSEGVTVLLMPENGDENQAAVLTFSKSDLRMIPEDTMATYGVDPTQVEGALLYWQNLYSGVYNVIIETSDGDRMRGTINIP